MPVADGVQHGQPVFKVVEAADVVEAAAQVPQRHGVLSVPRSPEALQLFDVMNLSSARRASHRGVDGKDGIGCFAEVEDGRLEALRAVERSATGNAVCAHVRGHELAGEAGEAVDGLDVEGGRHVCGARRAGQAAIPALRQRGSTLQH